MSDDTAVLREELRTISSQQREILTALSGMKPQADGSNITFLQADVNAAAQKIEKELEAQKKTGETSAKLLPSSRLELIGWKRGSQGVQRFYRQIGR